MWSLFGAVLGPFEDPISGLRRQYHIFEHLEDDTSNNWTDLYIFIGLREGSANLPIHMEHHSTREVSWEQERILRDLPRRPRKVLGDAPPDAHSLGQAITQAPQGPNL